MAKSKNSIPKRGKNPAQLQVALDKKSQALAHALDSVHKLSQMVAANSNILGQLVVMFEVLKDKGQITNEEITAKFKDLEAKRKAAEEEREATARKELDAERHKLAHPEEADGKVIEFNKDGAKGSTVQPKEVGGDEDNQ